MLVGQTRCKAVLEVDATLHSRLDLCEPETKLLPEKLNC